MSDHPNDSQPRSPELLDKLRALGDEKSQGLDPYWKWGFCSGWNAALDAASTRTQGADEAAPLHAFGCTECLGKGVIHDEGDIYACPECSKFKKVGADDAQPVASDEPEVDPVKALWVDDARPVDALGWTRNYEVDNALILLGRIDVSGDDDLRVDQIAAALRSLATRDAAPIDDWAEIRNTLHTITLLCEESGEPCDGFRFRELVLHARRMIAAPRDK